MGAPGSDADTIAAIATAPGGGIGIVRASGPSAEALLAALLDPLPSPVESHRLYHGRIRDPEGGAILDEALACLMRGPRSYTGEDVIEIQGHGGALNLGRILRAVLRAGARVAEPGEFTRRAFRNGRIDLSRAEAVAEVIAARSDRALRLAQAQLRGALAGRVGALRGGLVEVLAEVEGRIDFPDEALDFLPAARLAAALEPIAAETAALAGTFARGKLARGGVDVALVGRPNAGKSSLLNALAGEERALVHPEPGTTRDFVEAELVVGGLAVTVVDTAGERDAPGDVERRGLALGRRRREGAEVIVVVVDAEAGFGPVEERLLGEEGGARRIVAWNKCDLRPAPAATRPGVALVATSALRGEGIDALRSALREAIGDLGDDGAPVVASARQEEALREAAAAIGAGAAALRRGEPPELAAVDLRIALDRFGRITGETVDAEVLDAIFSRFCVGK